MNNEEKLLLSVCRSYFDGRRLEIPGEIDWNSFYILTKNHNLTSVCHCVFNDNKVKVPEQVQALFLDRFLDLVLIYEKQSSTFSDIKECLKNEAVPFVAFKGIVLKDIYPVPESRTMGDIDILIHQSDEKRLKSALKKIDVLYENTYAFVDTYKRDGIVIEVHRKLDEKYCKSFDDAFERAVFTENEGRFDDNYHLAYLIAHTAKHFRNYGAGIRLVLDIAFMLKEKSINIQQVFEILEKSNLEKFGKILLSVCRDWFGIGEKYVQVSSKVYDSFISCGAFTNSFNSDAQTVSRLKTLDAIKKGKNSTPLKLKLKLAFPSYDNLKKLPYIKFINGRRWLVPVAWIYRFFYNFKNRRKQMYTNIKNIDDKKTMELARDELEFLEEVGLM